MTTQSYLSRFFHQTKQNFDLNPIVTSAVSSERQYQMHAVKSPNASSNQIIDKRSGWPFTGNYSILHRPKLNCRRESISTRPYNGSIIEQEIRALTRGIDTDNAILQRYDRRARQMVGADGSNNSILKPRLSNPDIYGTTHGTPNAYSNINRYHQPEQMTGLSIISTPAPVQYKDETVSKTELGSVAPGSLDTKGNCG